MDKVAAATELAGRERSLCAGIAVTGASLAERMQSR